MPKNRSRAEDGSVKKQAKFHELKPGEVEKDMNFEWIIAQFILAKSTKLIDVQKFVFSAVGIQGGPVTRWCFYLKKSESKAVGIFLQLEQGSPAFQGRVVVTFQVVKENGEIVGQKKYNALNLVEGKGLGLKKFLPGDRDKLEQLIWEDGSLHLKINLKFISKAAEVEDKPKVDVEEELRRLEKNEKEKLVKIATEGICGVVRPEAGHIMQLACEDSKVFWGNTLMLSARVPAMNKLLDFGPLKAELEAGCSKSVNFGGVSGRTMEVLLHFIYGGTLVREEWRDKEVIVQLTWVARMWGLESLAQFLDKVLPEIEVDEETMAQLAWLTKRVNLKNAEKGIRDKLRGRVGAEEEEVDQLIEEVVKVPLFQMDPTVVYV